MKDRFVVITIDTITELFKDYCGQEEIPADARPVRLLLKPNELGRLAILMDSPSWKRGLAPLRVHFDIRRIHAV